MYSRYFGIATSLIVNNVNHEAVFNSYRLPWTFQTEAKSFYLMQVRLLQNAMKVSQDVRIIECSIRKRSAFETLMTQLLQLPHQTDSSSVSSADNQIIFKEAESLILSNFLERPIEKFDERPDFLTSISELLGSNSMPFSRKAMLQITFGSDHQSETLTLMLEKANKIIAFNHIQSGESHFDSSMLLKIQLTIRKKVGERKQLFMYNFEDERSPNIGQSPEWGVIKQKLVSKDVEKEFEGVILTNNHPIDLDQVAKQAVSMLNDDSSINTRWLRIDVNQFVHNSIIKPVLDYNHKTRIQIDNEHLLTSSILRHFEWHNQVIDAVLSHSFHTVHPDLTNKNTAVLLDKPGSILNYAVYCLDVSEIQSENVKISTPYTDAKFKEMIHIAKMRSLHPEMLYFESKLDGSSLIYMCNSE